MAWYSFFRRSVALPPPARPVQPSSRPGSGKGVTDVDRFNGLVPLTAREWPVLAAKAWDMPSARDAAVAGTGGRFEAISDLAKAMNNDPTFAVCRERRLGALTRTPVTVEPANGSAEAQQVAAALEAHLAEMIPDAELWELLGWWHDVGVAPFYVDYPLDMDADEWIPQLRAMNPRWMTYNPATYRFQYSAQEGLLDVTPGDGRWGLLLKWRYMTYPGKASTCVRAWGSKQFGEADWNKWSDANSDPILVGTYPNGGDNDAGTQPDGATQFIQQLFRARTTKVIGCAQGSDASDSYGVEVLKTGDAAIGSSFKERMEYYDRKIAEVWLGSNLAFEVTDKGSYAAAQTHKGVTRELVQGDARALEDVLNPQLVYPFVCMNFGQAVASRSCPKIVWHIDVEEDTAGVTKAFAQFTQGLKQASDAGYEVENLNELGDRFGFRFKRVLQPTQVKDAAIPTTDGDGPTADSEATSDDLAKEAT